MVKQRDRCNCIISVVALYLFSEQALEATVAGAGGRTLQVLPSPHMSSDSMASYRALEKQPVQAQGFFEVSRTTHRASLSVTEWRGEGTPAPEMAAFSLPSARKSCRRYMHSFSSIFFRKSV